jgi:hypothetical protein
MEAGAVARAGEPLVAISCNVAIRVAQPLAAHMTGRHAVCVTDAGMTGACTETTAAASACATTSAITSAMRKR